MYPIYVSKALAVASSNGLGSVSTAATSVVTLNTSAMDTARRVVFYSTAGSSTVTYTVRGYIEGGGIKYETVIGSSTAGTAATTLWDYTQLISVSVSSNLSIATQIGTSSLGGTPWKVAESFDNPQDIAGMLEFSSSSSGMTAQFDVTMDDPTGTYPDPYHLTPRPFNSTSPVGGNPVATGVAIGALSVDGNTKIPFYAWRMTIGSTAGTTGVVYGTVVQSGT